MPGRQQKFDISGSPSTRLLPSTQRSPIEDDYESLSHSKWECKYHVVFNRGRVSDPVAVLSGSHS